MTNPKYVHLDGKFVLADDSNLNQGSHSSKSKSSSKSESGSPFSESEPHSRTSSSMKCEKVE